LVEITRGQTPVLRHTFNYKRLSLAGALAYEPGAVTHTSSLPCAFGKRLLR
jgi:hypothetical protein